MKVRITINPGDPERLLRAVFPGEIIPEGWEEVEIDTKHDLCNCGDKRQHHSEHRGICLVKGCECRQFQEAR